MPLSSNDLAALRAYLSTTAGGYLRNPIHEALVTCAICATPVDGYERCYRCNQSFGTTGLADRVGAIIYAISGTQSAHLMRGYKAQPPSQPQRALIAVLLAVAVGGHIECLTRLAGRPVTHWATVPSLPAKPGEHPLHRLVHPFMEFEEVTLTAAPGVQTPRAVSSGHFVTSANLEAGTHVLVLDDTWTSGGHAQSAAAVLHAAGAEEVSILTVARWIEPQFGHNRHFISSRLTDDFDPSICPWTAGSCP